MHWVFILFVKGEKWVNFGQGDLCWDLQWEDIWSIKWLRTTA